MTLSTTTASVSYVGNGATTSFDFGFEIPAGALVVTLTEDNVVTTLDSSAYSVTGLGSSSGGSVTLATAPTNSQTVTIRRVVSLTQSVALVTGAAIYADVVEGEFDRGRMIDQQLQEQLDRAVLVPVGSGLDPETYLTTCTTAATTAGSAAAVATAAATGAAASATSASASASAAQQAVGGTRVSLTDTTPAPLSVKLTAAGALSATLTNPGGNEILALALTTAGTARAIAGTDTTYPTSSADVAAAIAALAPSPQSFRNLLLGADPATNPWRRGTSVALSTGTTVTCPYPTVSGTGCAANYTFVDTNYALPNSSQVTSIDVYSTVAGSINVTVVKNNGSGSFTAQYSQVLAHTGGGWQKLTLTTPYSVPATGTYNIALSSSAVNFTSGTAPAGSYYGVAAVYTSGTFTASTASNALSCPITQYTYALAPSGYTADRWYAWAATGVPLTVSKQASGIAAAPFCFRIQRTAGSSAAGAIGFAQVVESINVIPWRGKTLTLKLPYRAGVNYSGGSSATVSLIWGTGTDEGAAAMSSGGWTGQTTGANSGITPIADGATWAAATLSLTVPDTAAELALKIRYVTSGTAGAADYFEVGPVELDAYGATAFEVLPVDIVLRRCERYFRVRSSAPVAADLAYEMRATPTITGSGPYYANAEL